MFLPDIGDCRVAPFFGGGVGALFAVQHAVPRRLGNVPDCTRQLPAALAEENVNVPM
jgi:hypothetical protein